MLKKTVFFLILGTLKVTSLHAIPYYLWDNQDALVQANDCNIELLKSTKFRISGETRSKVSGIENLRLYNDVKQSNLVSGSLIKLTEDKKKRNYTSIEVVGPVKHPKLKANKWFSERLDKGYLFNGSVRKLENYVIKMNSQAPQVKINTKTNLRDLYFKALHDGRNYHKISCGDVSKQRDYTAFSVHQRKDEAPIAYVGVYWDETNIFRSISTTKASSNDWRGSILGPDKATSTSRNVERANSPSPKAPKPSKTNALTIAGVNVSTGSSSRVVCLPAGGSLAVRSVYSNGKNKYLFNAVPFERVSLFNSVKARRSKVRGKSHLFIKVKLHTREAKDEQIGWVAKNYIKRESECNYKKPSKVSLRNRNKYKIANKAKSLEDKKCCIFPVKARPKVNYVSNRVAKFNAARSSARKHAANDLYRTKGEPVLSVAPGKVIVGRRNFYLGSYSIVVKHVGGKIIRYGEINGTVAANTSSKSRISAGQTLGYVAQLITKKGTRLPPMLHLELYSGRGRGKEFSGTGGNFNNTYQRRSDLINPTNYVRRWEKANFGKSY